MADREYDKYLRKQRQLFKDYFDTFSSKAGARVLEDLEAEFVNLLSFVKGDPHETSFNEGARSSVLHIHRYMELCRNPAQFDELYADTGDNNPED